MPICVNLGDIAQQVGFKMAQEATLAISGKLVVPLALKYKECEITAAITIVFNHQNIITSASYEIKDTLYNFIEELVIKDFNEEINNI